MSNNSHNSPHTADLPAGWVWTTLDEACDIIMGQSPPSETYNTEGVGLPFYQGKAEFGDLYPTPVKWCSQPGKIAEAGDVLITVRAPVGPTNLCREKSCIGRGLAAIRPKDGMPSLYILYLLRNVADEIAGKATGTTFSAISGKVLRDQVVPLAPTAEQHRIVAKIEEQFTRLDAGVVALKRAQTNLKRYKAAVLKAACEGKLTDPKGFQKPLGSPDDEPASELLKRILVERRAKWAADLRAKGKDPQKAKYEEPQAPDLDELPELPSGWCWTTLPQLGELARGKSKHRPRNEPRLFGGPYPFIQTGEIRQADGVIARYSETYSEFGLAQSRLWRKGALCITIAANIAETAILGFDACFPDSVVGFVADESACDVRFVEFFIRTAKEDLKRYAPATAQKNINLDTLQKLAVPLPPLAEQRRIVAEVERRLSVVQELDATLTANLARAERLRQSILKRAFEGKLVP